MSFTFLMKGDSNRKKIDKSVVIDIVKKCEFPVVEIAFLHDKRTVMQKAMKL